MSIIELKMPKMGESISEATILNWLSKVGDEVYQDDTILEVATDKVDSEVPSPCNGILKEIKFDAKSVVNIGEVIAIIESSDDIKSENSNKNKEVIDKKQDVNKNAQENSNNHQTKKVKILNSPNSDAFLSPLIISIAQKENLSIEEVQSIQGTGNEGRIRKSDVFNYIKNRKYPLHSKPIQQVEVNKSSYNAPSVKFVEGYDTIIEMDRMRKMIADHMVYSKHTSPHVTAYIEVDVTNLVNWRNKNKQKFLEKHQQKLTFTPIFVDAVAKAIVDFPGINASIKDDFIIQRKDINIGMATALPSGNLIVPVVKNADTKNMLELATDVNKLVHNSRNNCLKPDEIQGSTFTISNVGTFGSLMGTPIINQPEVAILALGIIKKKAEVITKNDTDEIQIRSMMYLSLSFDHRAVDGYLGGSFLRKVGDYLEQFNDKQEI